MIPPRQQARSGLHRPTPPPEHGDWRVALSRPEEAEHYRNPPLSMWKKTKLRLEQLENSTSLGELWRHSVNVTYTADDAYGDDEPLITPISGWRRVLHLLLALLLLPLSITMVYALALQLYHALPATTANSQFWLSDPIYFSALGTFTFIALIIAKFCTPILVYAYVLGHELTHALTALCFLGRVDVVNVDIEGGYIETDKDNVIIALAPYFVPLWLIVWVLVTSVFYLFFDSADVDPWFFGGCGFWWSFHIFWTMWVIPREQPDLLENGVMFSLLFVVIMNIFILIGILRFFNFISLRGYWQDFLSCGERLIETCTWLLSLCGG